jgi:hypothetical protein
VKIATDDALLFGSLAAASAGLGLVVGRLTLDPWLAVGVTLVVFGVTSALLAFLAAQEPPK